MNKILSTLLLFSFLSTTSAIARVVEIDVHGMTCEFCVDSLERKFDDMKNISDVKVSLKNNKIRLITAEKLPKLDVLKNAVLDTGFTPIKIKVLKDEVTEGKSNK